jgi:hypothetical protein
MPDIHLRVDNGQYVRAEGGGGREVVATRPGSGPWERFEVEYAFSYSDTSSGGRIEPYRDEDGQYYWHCKAANNRKRTHGGEGHHNKEYCRADALAARGEPRADVAIYDMLDEEEEEEA